MDRLEEVKMEGVSLVAISKRLNPFSWRLLQIIHDHPSLTKKDLFEKLGEKSRRKFEIEYAKLYGASLIEERTDVLDGRSLNVRLTDEGKKLLSMKDSLIIE
jgi:DNA-binding MarR family transcriptional regulator